MLCTLISHMQCPIYASTAAELKLTFSNSVYMVQVAPAQLCSRRPLHNVSHRMPTLRSLLSLRPVRPPAVAGLTGFWKIFQNRSDSSADPLQQHQHAFQTGREHNRQFIQQGGFHTPPHNTAQNRSHLGSQPAQKLCLPCIAVQFFRKPNTSVPPSHIMHSGQLFTTHGEQRHSA